MSSIVESTPARFDAVSYQERLLERLKGDEKAIATVLIRVGDQSYQIDTRHIDRVERVQSIAPIPGSPAEVMGFVHISGQPVVVVDLLAILNPDMEPVRNPNSVYAIQLKELHCAIICEIDPDLAQGEQPLQIQMDQLARLISEKVML